MTGGRLQPSQTAAGGYLLAVAAGPYHSVRTVHAGLPFGLHIRRSLGEYLDRDADELFDITRRGLSLESEDSLNHSLQPFGPWPQDAIADLAERIIGRIREPMPQAMAIYEWLVDHAGPNCAPGSAPEAINNTLCRSFDKTDKGEDAGLTGLFVALCRATGIPARFVSGQRLGPSRQSPSLGVAGNAASAQHCRAEFHAANYGWVPVDPADAARARAIGCGELVTVIGRFWALDREDNWERVAKCYRALVRGEGTLVSRSRADRV